jgi:hypothetical protein
VEGGKKDGSKVANQAEHGWRRGFQAAENNQTWLAAADAYGAIVSVTKEFIGEV